MAGLAGALGRELRENLKWEATEILGDPPNGGTTSK